MRQRHPNLLATGDRTAGAKSSQGHKIAQTCAEGEVGEQWLRCVQSVVQFPRSGAQGDHSGNHSERVLVDRALAKNGI
jgi:hypothetical protein